MVKVLGLEIVGVGLGRHIGSDIHGPGLKVAFAEGRETGLLAGLLGRREPLEEAIVIVHHLCRGIHIVPGPLWLDIVLGKEAVVGLDRGHQGQHPRLTGWLLPDTLSGVLHGSILVGVVVAAGPEETVQDGRNLHLGRWIGTITESDFFSARHPVPVLLHPHHEVDGHELVAVPGDEELVAEERVVEGLAVVDEGVDVGHVHVARLWTLRLWLWLGWVGALILALIRIVLHLARSF